MALYVDSAFLNSIIVVKFTHDWQMMKKL